MMTTPKYVLVLPVAASLRRMPKPVEAAILRDGGAGRRDAEAPGPQAAGCPQPRGYYYQRRGYDRDGDEWRYADHSLHWKVNGLEQ
jgi:hypothetical protein